MVRATRHNVTKTVESASEFREARDAADTLGLTLTAVEFLGQMTANDDRYPFRARANTITVEDRSAGQSSCDFDTFEVGYKWFTVKVDGDVTQIRPVANDYRGDDGHIRLFFDS